MDFKKTHISVIGDFTLVTQTGGVTPVIKHEYLHRDHIGSIVAISKSTVASANDVQWQSNGAWGERRYQHWNGPLDNLLNPDSTAKGFTDHEHLDAVGLIHMNGRVYDPELGRSMSADPFVQAPYNSQSYNRYSYVFNNPLSFTDPTGYITKDYCPGNTTATCTSDNKDKEEPAPEEVIVTGDREQHLRRMEAVDQSNLAGWINWTNHQHIIADATAGILITQAHLNGGSIVLDGHKISVLGNNISGGNNQNTGIMPGGMPAMGVAPNPKLVIAALVVGGKLAYKKVSTLFPGPYAKESIKGHRGKPTADEQRKINELMEKNGCHTCGTNNPGTKSGNAIVDHQPPQALGETEIFLPHCIVCMRRQGGEVAQELFKMRAMLNE